jgi:hypothetical protein
VSLLFSIEKAFNFSSNLLDLLAALIIKEETGRLGVSFDESKTLGKH